MNPRLFRVATDHGSKFAVHFSPCEYLVAGQEVGKLIVVGFSKKAGREIRVEGLGFVPEPGGMITVSDVAEEVVDYGEGEVAFFPSEEIIGVKEIALPPDVLNEVGVND